MIYEEEMKEKTVSAVKRERVFEVPETGRDMKRLKTSEAKNYNDLVKSLDVLSDVGDDHEDISFSQKVKEQSEVLDQFENDRSVSEEPRPLNLKDLSKTVSFGQELKPAMAHQAKK